MSESSKCANSNLSIKQVLDQKGSATILDIAPELNLRKHSTQVVKYTSKRSTLALKPRADVIRSLKQGYQWPHKKTRVLQIFLKNQF